MLPICSEILLNLVMKQLTYITYIPILKITYNEIYKTELNNHNYFIINEKKSLNYKDCFCNRIKNNNYNNNNNRGDYIFLSPSLDLFFFSGLR